MPPDKVIRLVVLLVSIAGFGHAGSAWAQERFSAHVFEGESTRPVKSTIEYEQAPNLWRPIRATEADGSLSGVCPGRVSIRANAWPEFRPSQMELCGGSHRLKVERRPVSAYAILLEGKSTISLDQWVQAGAIVAVSEARRDPYSAQSPGLAVFSDYVTASDEISPRRRELIETRLLNAWAVDFQQVDSNGDQLISPRELRAAIATPN